MAQGPAVASASRIVALDLGLSEILLSLGARPLAIANIPLYRRLVADPPAPAEVADLGPLNEPNLEFLQYLKPDLILAASWQAAGQRHLEKIAPVAWLSTFSREGQPLRHAHGLLQQVARMVGRETEAQAQAQAADAAFLEARAALAGQAAKPVYVVRFMEDGRHLAIFGRNGIIGDVMDRVGLRNAWAGKTNAWGNATIGVEQLMETPDAAIVHFDRGAETERALRRLRQSPLWNALPAVREGRVVAMPVVYPSGGLYSARRFAEQLAQALPRLGQRHG